MGTQHQSDTDRLMWRWPVRLHIGPGYDPDGKRIVRQELGAPGNWHVWDGPFLYLAGARSAGYVIMRSGASLHLSAGPWPVRLICKIDPHFITHIRDTLARIPGVGDMGYLMEDAGYSLAGGIKATAIHFPDVQGLYRFARLSPPIKCVREGWNKPERAPRAVQWRSKVC